MHQAVNTPCQFMKKDSNKYAWEVAFGNNDKWNVFKNNNSKDKFKTISYLLQNADPHAFFCVCERLPPLAPQSGHSALFKTLLAASKSWLRVTSLSTASNASVINMPG